MFRNKAKSITNFTIVSFKILCSHREEESNENIDLLWPLKKRRSNKDIHAIIRARKILKQLSILQMHIEGVPKRTKQAVRNQMNNRRTGTSILKRNRAL